MRLLLDTHVLLWFLTDDPRLGKHAETVSDPGNDVYVSAVSLFEIMVKIRAGKLRLDIAELLAETEKQGFEFLPLSPRHVTEMSGLPVFEDHKDPFDHQLIAQAIAEDMLFLSYDRQTKRYPVKLLD